MDVACKTGKSNTQKMHQRNCVGGCFNIYENLTSKENNNLQLCLKDVNDVKRPIGKSHKFHDEFEKSLGSIKKLL